MRGAAAETIEQTVCNEGCDLRGFDVLKCTGICTNHCDRRHGAAFPNERHSSCQHGSGARKKALFEPGDTKRQWKGEAAACFVHTGIASSRTLPTSSVGYWSPLLSLCNASASEATCSFGGDFLRLNRVLMPPHRLENTNSFPSGSLNLAMVPQISFFGSSASSTPFDLSICAVANTSSHQNVTG